MNNDHCQKNDIAFQKLEDELQTSRKTLKAIYDSTPYSIFLLSANYNIIFFNKWARDGSKLLYNRDMVLGESLLNYRVEGDEEIHKSFKTNFEQAILTKRVIISELEMHYPQMSFWVRSEYAPVYTDDDQLIGVLLNVQNISDRKQFQSMNEEKQLQLRQIAWSQSHETRQPLASLMGLVSLLDKESMTQENQEIIRLLEQTASRLEKVIHQNVTRANLHLHDQTEQRS
ncbi:MAG: PAS domain S-box protein [Cyclobacteriaceae bacterium]|nr:PAS domain S-box protein [Cyclobacteriaceae bacterium]